jgi:hypothetical protein
VPQQAGSGKQLSAGKFGHVPEVKLFWHAADAVVAPIGPNSANPAAINRTTKIIRVFINFPSSSQDGKI